MYGIFFFFFNARQCTLPTKYCVPLPVKRFYDHRKTHCGGLQARYRYAYKNNSGTTRRRYVVHLYNKLRYSERRVAFSKIFLVRFQCFLTIPKGTHQSFGLIKRVPQRQVTPNAYSDLFQTCARPPEIALRCTAHGRPAEYPPSGQIVRRPDRAIRRVKYVYISSIFLWSHVVFDVIA